MRLVLATQNAHKLREFRRLLEGVELVALPEAVQLPPETGSTFAENAWPKARSVAAAIGLAAIADDSGIESQALAGGPGVRSARYAGERASDAENLDRLRREVPVGSGLRYVCALAYVEPDRDREQLFTGRCHGTMATQPRGDGGFGYDPIFVPDEARDGRTMAELSDSEKDAISHRGDAARQLLAWLRG